MVLAALVALLLLDSLGTAIAAEPTFRVSESETRFEADPLAPVGSTGRNRREATGRVSNPADEAVCVGGACPAGATDVQFTFRIYGSSTIGAKLMPALIEAHARSLRLRPKRILGTVAEEVLFRLKDERTGRITKIHLQSHGSGTSFPALASGKALVGMSSRPVRSKEIKLMSPIGVSSAGDRGFEHVLALDGLLIIVSRQNPLPTISVGQLIGIFSGQITDWSEIGMPPGPINVYSRDTKSGTFDTFNAMVLRPLGQKLSRYVNYIDSDAELSDAVATDPHGIGFTSFAYVRNAKPLAIETECGIVHAPSMFGMKSEEYPLTRRLFLYTPPKLNAGYVAALIRFAKSSSAQEVIAGAGYIDQSPNQLTFMGHGDRIADAFAATGRSFNLGLMRDLMNQLKGYARLSTTFRFRFGSSVLDTRSRQNLKPLIRELQSGSLANREVILVGFTDTDGPFDKNLDLSLRRANSVKQAILDASDHRLGRVHLLTKGYGELMPVRCNTNEAGRQRNRRVEVWVGHEVVSAAAEPDFSSDRPIVDVVGDGPANSDFVEWLAREKK